MDDNRIIGDARVAVQNVHRLAGLIVDATEMQWERSTAPVRVEKVGGRSPGVSDPTSDTALDPRRLKLRSAMLEAAASLRHLDGQLRETTAYLESVISEFEGR